MKKDAFYFPHDSNAKDDPKCILMVEAMGLEAYGIFWVLVEILREQPDYCYPISLLPAISRRYNTQFDKVKRVVTEFGLFDIKDDQFFYSPALNARMIPLQDKREKMRELAQKRWGKNNDAYALQTHNEGNANEMQEESESNAEALHEQSEGNASKVKKSKVEYSKVKKSKEEKSNNSKTGKHLFSSSPYFDFEFFKKSLDGKFQNLDLEYYYEVAKNYSESKKAMYADWLAAIRNWMLRDMKDGKALIFKASLSPDEQKAARMKKIEETYKKLNDGNQAH